MADPMTAREALQTVYSRLMHLHPDWTPDAREACILTALVAAHESRCKAFDADCEAVEPNEHILDSVMAFHKLRSLERGEEASRGR